MSAQIFKKAIKKPLSMKISLNFKLHECLFCQFGLAEHQSVVLMELTLYQCYHLFQISAAFVARNL